MVKHLVDIDDETPNQARAQLGTGTIQDTVNPALRQAGRPRSNTVEVSLDGLARADAVEFARRRYRQSRDRLLGARRTGSAHRTDRAGTRPAGHRIGTASGVIGAGSSVCPIR
jgi:hypothetical protein